MFYFTVNKNEIIMTESETITSGSVNAYECKFDFSEDWEGLAKTVTFRAGYVKISVILDSTNMCSIPWEVLEKDAVQLYCGVRGTVTAYDEEEDAIIPTVYCLLGTIRKGTELGDNAAPPEPSVVDQLVSRIEALDADKQDKLTGTAGQVVGFDADGNAIAQDNESPVYTAGDNISISGNVISAKNSTYSIVRDEELETPGTVAEYHLVDNTKADAVVIVGDSIAIPDMRYDDTEIHSEMERVSALTDEVSAATAANTSAISAINDSVSAINTKLDRKQDKLTAGDNVHIENNVISADMYDDTKIRSYIAKLDADKQSRLTAGDHINIENNVISADMYDDTKIRSDIAKLDAGKQNKLHGTAGQVVGFDESGNAIAQDGGSGTPGADGVTFTPSVNALGVISWTNDGGRENPEPVNIKGPQGPQGPRGPQGDPGVAGAAGVDGADGFSPTVDITAIEGGHKVTITDKNGPHDFNVTNGTDGSDGAPGAAGADGFSPTVSVSEISNGHKVTITDKNGPHDFNVTNGSDGMDGLSAGFGNVTATVSNTTGTPNVTVTASGPDTAKNFSFAFSGLKGESGTPSHITTYSMSATAESSTDGIIDQTYALTADGLDKGDYIHTKKSGVHIDNDQNYIKRTIPMFTSITVAASGSSTINARTTTSMIFEEYYATSDSATRYGYCVTNFSMFSGDVSSGLTMTAEGPDADVTVSYIDIPLSISLKTNMQRSVRKLIQLQGGGSYFSTAIGSVSSGVKSDHEYFEAFIRNNGNYQILRLIPFLPYGGTLKMSLGITSRTFTIIPMS